MAAIRFVGYVRYETTTVLEFEQEFKTEVEADEWVAKVSSSMKPGHVALGEPRLKSELLETDVFRTDCNY